MTKRRIGMLAVLLVLFGLATWLIGSGDPEKPEGTAVAFPRAMTPEAQRRGDARRTHAVHLPANADGERRVVQQDPLLASLPRGEGKTAVVLEANAIRNSPLGEMILSCLGPGVPAKLKEESGIDVLQDLDRVAVTADGLTISGDFGEADWDRLLPPNAHRASYGDGGRIYTIPGDRSEQGPRSVAVWGNGMIVVGSEDELKRTIDRLEGRGEDAPPALDESQAYGEVYGVVASEDLARFFGEEAKTAPLGELLRQAGSNLELHADTQGDVGLVARLAGGEPAVVRDVGKAMGGLLSAARIEAMASGQADALRLLDMASLKTDEGDFNFEVALPQSYLAELAKECEARHAQRQAAARAHQEALATEPAGAEDAVDEHVFEPAPNEAAPVE